MLVDANLLLFAVDSGSPFHRPALTWWTRVLSEPVRVGLPWATLTAFLRIATHPRASHRPLPGADAWAIVEEWLRHPAVWVPAPTDRHHEVLGRLFARYRVAGNLVPDAHLAALAIEHGVTLCSADTDFARFSELQWDNPVAG